MAYLSTFLLVNDYRRARVAELLADFTSLQFYIAAAPVEPPNQEDYYTEGWRALRQCSVDGQHILNTGADTTVPVTKGGQEEQVKAELQQVHLDALARRHQGQKIYLRQAAAQRWIEWRNGILQGKKPSAEHQAALQACDEQLWLVCFTPFLFTLANFQSRFGLPSGLPFILQLTNRNLLKSPTKACTPRCRRQIFKWAGGLTRTQACEQSSAGLVRGGNEPTNDSETTIKPMAVMAVMATTTGSTIFFKRRLSLTCNETEAHNVQAQFVSLCFLFFLFFLFVSFLLFFVSFFSSFHFPGGRSTHKFA